MFFILAFPIEISDRTHEICIQVVNYSILYSGFLAGMARFNEPFTAVSYISASR